MAEFISLYSGSSGNSSVVRCGSRYLIVDMGKGVRTTSAALKALGLAVSDCDGILVTHEHSDHVKGLSTFLKKNPLPVYGAADTLDFLDANGIVPPSCELNTLEGREEDVGAFGVQSFPTSHDVPCVGYRIHTPDGKTMTIATDLGVLTPPVHEALAGCGASVQRRVLGKTAGAHSGRVQALCPVPSLAGEQHSGTGPADGVQYAGRSGRGAGQRLHRAGTAPQ